MVYMFIEIIWKHKQWFGYNVSRKYTYSQILRSYYVSLCFQHTQKQPFIYLLEYVVLSSDSHSQSPCLVRHTNFGECCINGSYAHWLWWLWTNVTKARACKGASQEWSLRVTFHAPRSVRKCEGMNLHIPKWVPILEIRILMNSWIFWTQLKRSKFIGKYPLYHWKALGT